MKLDSLAIKVDTIAMDVEFLKIKVLPPNNDDIPEFLKSI